MLSAGYKENTPAIYVLEVVNNERAPRINLRVSGRLGIDVEISQYIFGRMCFRIRKIG